MSPAADHPSLEQLDDCNTVRIEATLVNTYLSMDRRTPGEDNDLRPRTQDGSIHHTGDGQKHEAPDEHGSRHRSAWKQDTREHETHGRSSRGRGARPREATPRIGFGRSRHPSEYGARGIERRSRHDHEAGRLAYEAGRMPRRLYASASSPLDGLASF